MFIIDHANDLDDYEHKALEALIRRLWTARPTTRIIIVGSPRWDGLDTSDNGVVETPYNETELDNVKALADHYGIAYADYWQWCIDNVPETYDLVDLTADKIHPTATGAAGMAAQVLPFLPAGGTQKPGTLPARLYDNGDYENDPVRTNGTDYDSRTGSGWVDDGTSTSSSTEGDTITFSATCQSFGAYRSDAGNNDVEVSIDSGPFLGYALDNNGTETPGGRDAHTFVIRIPAGGNVTIDEFWAV